MPRTFFNLIVLG